MGLTCSHGDVVEHCSAGGGGRVLGREADGGRVAGTPGEGEGLADVAHDVARLASDVERVAVREEDREPEPDTVTSTALSRGEHDMLQASKEGFEEDYQAAEV